MRLFLFSVVQANMGNSSMNKCTRPRPSKPPDNIVLRSRMRMHRVELNMTISELSQICNIAEKDLIDMEKGKGDVQTIHRVDQALGTRFLTDHLIEKKKHK